MERDASGVSALVGLDGFVVTAQLLHEETGEWWLAVETLEERAWCGTCGVRATGHRRRRVRVRDLPLADRPVVLVWAKRLWRCDEPACPARTWSEECDEIAPRAVLTERARAEVCRRVGPGEQSVAAVARAFGVSWHAAMAAVRDHGRPRVDHLARSEVTIWTVGFCVPDLASRSGLSTDAMGRLLTDETLTSVDDERIVAAGDSAAPSDLPLRMSCQPRCRWVRTLPTRCSAGSQVSNRRLSPRGSTASASAWVVGPASSSSPKRNDVARGFLIGGRLGAKTKELICGSTIKGLVHEARKPGSFKWHAKDDKHQQLLQARHGETPNLAEPFA